MRRLSFITLVLVVWLAACGTRQPAAPVIAATDDVPATAIPIVPTETQAPEGKLPAAPFEAQTYVNEEAGFALDYPAGWTVNEVVIGPRGTQIQFLSSPELAEAAVVPEGGTRFVATINQWDPKNDLAAFVQQRKEAWTASGFTTLDEQQLTLEQGLPAVQFTLQTPESQVVFLVAALQDQYLVLSGEGDLELARQMMERLRPISK